MHHNDPISPTNRIIFGLLRSSLWNQDFPSGPSHADPDWDAVWAELKQHAVQILPVDLLAKLDPANRDRYIRAGYRSVARYYRLMQQQQIICGLLQEAGIACVVLKGASAAGYYPKPANRCMGDIDLMVMPQDFESARQILSEGSEYLGENYRHIELRRNGVVVELHRCYATFHNEAFNRLLDERICRAIPRAAVISQEGFSFPSLPALENGLTLLTHLNIHMESGLGLRQIIDWMMFADRHLDDRFWHTEFGPAARELGLETLAVTVTKMCQMYLGLRQDLTWCGNAEDDLCAELMAHTMNQGNFGRKMPKGFNSTVSVLSTARSLPNLLRALQRHGCINWTALRRFPWLKPFAWLYQLCRYIRRGLQKERPLRTLLQSIRNTGKQDTLLDRLGVTRVKQEHK